MTKGLILAGAAFTLLVTGCATQGSASDYGTNATCCATPASCTTTCVQSSSSCKGLPSCKGYVASDTSDTSDVGNTTVKSRKVYRKKVSRMHG